MSATLRWIAADFECQVVGESRLVCSPRLPARSVCALVAPWGLSAFLEEFALEASLARGPRLARVREQRYGTEAHLQQPSAAYGGGPKISAALVPPKPNEFESA